MIRLTETKINAESAKLDEWLKIDIIIITFKKSRSTWFNKARQNINLTLRCDHVVIDRVDYFNFLGITIDSQMMWTNHTDNT